MVVLAERSLQTVILNAISTFRQNLSTFVPDIYAQETSEHQQEITNFWSNTANNPPVIIGYSLQPNEDMQIAITNEPSSEVANRRFVGNTYMETSTGYEYTTTFEASYAMHVFGINQNWLLWGQALVLWALMMNRNELETTYALENQRLSLSALQPAPDSLKDSVFPYKRTVFLSCQFQNTWTPLAGSSVSSASVTLDVTT